MASLILEEGPFPLVQVGALELVVEHGHVELQRAYQVLAQLAAFEMGCLGNQSKKYFSTLLGIPFYYRAGRQKSLRIWTETKQESS